MEGSDYEDKWSQQADDVGWMSNYGKRKISPRNKRIEANHNKSYDHNMSHKTLSHPYL